MTGVLAAAHDAAVLGHVGTLGHLGVHVLLPLPLLLLPPLLLRLVSTFLLEDGAVSGGVLLLRLGQRSLVTTTARPAHQPGTVVLENNFAIKKNIFP